MILYSSINDSIAQIHQTNKNESMTNGMKQGRDCTVVHRGYTRQKISSSHSKGDSEIFVTELVTQGADALPALVGKDATYTII